MTRIAPIIVLICAISGVFFGFVFFDHSHDKPTNPPEGSAQKQKSKKQDRLKSAPEVDFGPYMAALQRRIKHAWHPPKGDESKRVVVVFKVHTDGSMSNLHLVTSSGVALADLAAQKAIINAAPFNKLPAGSPENVDIQFTFDYNVFKGDKKQPFNQTEDGSDSATTSQKRF